MSNKELEKAIKEYTEQKNEEAEEEALKKLHKKFDDKELVWKRSDEIKYGFENSFEKEGCNYDEYETDELRAEETRKKTNTSKRKIEKNVIKKKVPTQAFIVAGAMIVLLSGVGVHKKYEINKGKERIYSKITSCLYSNDIISFNSSNGTVYYYKGHADDYIDPTDILLRDGFTETELAVYYNKVRLNFADDFNITLSERNNECLNEYYEMKLEEGKEKSNGR